MSAGSLVATGFGIVLLVVTAYILVGGTLSMAERAISAQSELAQQQEIRMRTSIEIVNATDDASASTLYIEIRNTGSEPIVNYSHMDVYVVNESLPIYYPYGSGSGSWSINVIKPDTIHPGQLDPDEVMNISVRYPGKSPIWIQVTTGNGVYDSVQIG